MQQLCASFLQLKLWIFWPFQWNRSYWIALPTSEKGGIIPSNIPVHGQEFLSADKNLCPWRANGHSSCHRAPVTATPYWKLIRISCQRQCTSWQVLKILSSITARENLYFKDLCLNKGWEILIKQGKWQTQTRPTILGDVFKVLLELFHQLAGFLLLYPSVQS